MDMIEKQVTISDAKEFEEMLKIMDYYEVMEINKTRRKGTYKEYEICLDEVETLGSFIEVEKISDEDGAKVHEELTTFLKSLGLQEENRVVYGYDTLILQNLKKKDAH
jgi:predicted adenylyl cyclase CyaB